MATYNGAQFLPRQLESIVSQLGSEDELVVSDDRSSDRSLDIVRAVEDPRVRISSNPSARSPVFNFENALRMARGDTLVLADQDDVWLPNRLETIRAKFISKPAGPFLIAFDAYVVDEQERVIHESLFAKINAGRGLLKNLLANRYVGCCMAFSRELLEIALPFPRKIPMHDMWLGQLCELVGTTEFVPERTTLYRRHSATTTEFRVRFKPITQISRRAILAWSLASRALRSRTARAQIR
jgi:glycosyltransferase involved in cell wall biosynthesis